MSERALLVSTANPYPVVRDGCERLVRDYVDAVFDGLELDFLHAGRPSWAPQALYRDGNAIATGIDADGLLERGYAFVVFVGFKDTAFTRELTTRRPSFCLTDAFPHPDVPRDAFRGILSHHASQARADADVLLVGGSYDDAVFRPDRRGEDHVLAVGRIHPDKNQLELVEGYREAIYEPFGLPLVLAGGATDLDYAREVLRHVDGTAVVTTIEDHADPGAPSSWLSAAELAALSNRSRLYVAASPAEAFGLALVESMACATTCVVNGDYRGFDPAELRPLVHGNVAGKRGSVLDLVAEALRDEVRIDASQWARRYALREIRDGVARFVHDRL
ncbi:MAG: hypothetical protein QOJ46_793 [bacterium]